MHSEPWAGDEWQAELFLVGGFLNVTLEGNTSTSYGEATVRRLLCAFHQHPAHFFVRLACVGHLNTGPAGGPCCSGAVYDIVSGALQPGAHCRPPLGINRPQASATAVSERVSTVTDQNMLNALYLWLGGLDGIIVSSRYKSLGMQKRSPLLCCSVIT